MFSPLSKTVSYVTLASALFGCRDERSASLSTAVVVPEWPLIVSLAQAKTGAEGERVYLKDVTVKPLTSAVNTRGRVTYEVIDQAGERMPAVLQAEPDSYLWQLAPGVGERCYRDFGGIIDRDSNQLTLTIFKLAN